MKIAFIGQKGIPARSGGVDRHVESLAFFLAKKGQEVIVYNRRGYLAKNISEWEGVKLVTLPFINSKNLAAISHGFLATIDALKCKVDVIHYHGIGPCLLAWIPKLIRPKTKIIATLHSFDYGNDKWGVFAKFMLKLGEKMMTKYADQVIVLTSLMRDYLYQRHGRESIVIPNGAYVQTNFGTEYLNKFNLEPKKYIISISRIIRLKGIQYLIPAFKNLQNSGRIDKSFKLVIVGDGEYLEELQKIAAANSNIIFAGNQSGEALNQLYSQAGLFVQSSEMEGLSISLLEAMAYGLPVLASDIFANHEAAGATALYFTSKDVPDLSLRLEEILSNTEKMSELAKAAQYRAETDFNWDKISDQTLEVYKK
jgi:glycosyltransferase involved in cell wall biosynthesis